MPWNDFVEMDREAFIDTEAKSLEKHEDTTKSSVVKEGGEHEEEVEEEEEKVEEKKEEIKEVG